MYDVLASKTNNVRIFERQAVKVLLLSLFGFGVLELVRGWEWRFSLAATLQYELRFFVRFLFLKSIPMLAFLKFAVLALGWAATRRGPKQALRLYTTTSVGLFALISLSWYVLVTDVLGMLPRAFLKLYQPLLLLFLAMLWLGARALQQR